MPVGAIELRALTTCEMRTAEGRRLSGYAARFNVTARIGDSFNETIKPGAFTNSLASGADVVALQDHRPDLLLGRTRSGTLTLAEDGQGLRFDLALPETTAANDLLELVKRGDVGGMSFGFVTLREAWPKPDQRELRAVSLKEISVVSAWPAYEGTSVAARSKTYAAAHPSLASVRRWLATL